MSKYEKLDALIVSSLNEFAKKFSAINVGDVARECERIAYETGTSRSRHGVPPYRVCDRRLQSLRKAGKIQSTSKGWVKA